MCYLMLLVMLMWPMPSLQRHWPLAMEGWTWRVVLSWSNADFDHTCLHLFVQHVCQMPIFASFWQASVIAESCTWDFVWWIGGAQLMAQLSAQEDVLLRSETAMQEAWTSKASPKKCASCVETSFFPRRPHIKTILLTNRTSQEESEWELGKCKTVKPF